MKAVKAIYNAPVTVIVNNDNITIVGIDYNGLQFIGTAKIHPEDKDFNSKKVGKNIATSRARIKILQYAYDTIQEELRFKEDFLHQLTGYGSKMVCDVDPTGALSRNIARTQGRVKGFKSALDKEKQSLAYYLEGHAKALCSVRALRAKAKEKDKDN